MAEQQEHSNNKDEHAVAVAHGSVPVNDENDADFSLSDRSTRELNQAISNIDNGVNVSVSAQTSKPRRNVSYADITSSNTTISGYSNTSNTNSDSNSTIFTRNNKRKMKPRTSQTDSVPSNASGGSGIRPSSLWARMGQESSLWETVSDLNNDDYDERGEKKICCTTSTRCVNCTQSIGPWLRSTLKTAISTPSIILTCLVLFISLVVCGALIIYGFETAESDSRKQKAVSVAELTDFFFVQVLEKAFSPLFTIAQFVKELPEFHMLDVMVGDRNDLFSQVGAPLLAGKEDSHRNLTNLFQSEYGQTIQKKFDRIAAGIKANSGLGKSLVSIQLAPKGVLTNIYPMINCKDFADIGQPCLDNTGAWGLDLMHDSFSQNTAFETVVAEEAQAVIVGPLNLIQGTNAFIGQLPINFDDEEDEERMHQNHSMVVDGVEYHEKHSMVVDGVDYPCWGFASVLLNWQRLKEESNIYKDFGAERMQFKLTRTDVTPSGQETVVTIAVSSNSHLIANDNITLALNAGNNGWVIAVGYDDGFNPNYKAWAYPILICSAFAFTILMMLVLVSKTQHERLLLNLMPARAIRKLRMGQTVVERYSMVTIFFSDIVGYTNMSSEMTPIEVMTMLNSLYSKLDLLAKKHDVFKVETIGDAYIAVAGAPNKCSGPRAAEKMTLFALDALQTVKDFHTEDGARIAIRAGLASGPAVAGVVGSSLPKYTLFGDTVNFAARMEQTSEKMKLQISPVTHRMLLDAPNYHFEREERRGEDGEMGVMIKGKGRQYTYWVTTASEGVHEKDSLLPTAGSNLQLMGNMDEDNINAREQTTDVNVEQVVAQDGQV
ncbi:hypothetical protein ACHAXR_005084 [Thalassiosira sp. AJA248-18]